MIHVGTCITEDYVEAARPFVRSLAQVRDVRRFVVTVGFDWIARDRRHFPDVEFESMPLGPALEHCSPDFVCLQHGAFLPYLPGVDEADTVLLLDGGDMTLQRDLAAAERTWLTGLDESAIALGPNGGPGDTLRQEFRRLSPTVSEATADRVFSGLDWPVYNCGAIAARPPVWRSLAAAYAAAWQARPLFANPRACQFLLCWCVRALTLRVASMPLSLHAHGHFGTPAGCYQDGGDRLCHAGQVVFARHAL